MKKNNYNTLVLALEYKNKEINESQLNLKQLQQEMKQHYVV